MGSLFPPKEDSTEQEDDCQNDTEPADNKSEVPMEENENPF
jgi:hypothetical protein